MSRTAAAACAVLLTLAGGAGAAGAAEPDPFFPGFGNRGYDVRRYELDLDVDAARQALRGRARLAVRATRGLAELALDLRGLTVDAVRVDGAAARFGRSAGKLRVRPASPIAAGRTFRVDVAYHGRPRGIDDPTAGTAPPIPRLGWLSWRDSSYVVSEPVGAANWFPVNDVPTDKASYRVAVTVEKPYTAVGNGRLRSVTDLGGRRRFVWEQAQPMASYLAIVDVDRYGAERLVGTNGVPILNYLTPNTPEYTRSSLRAVPAMMAFFEARLGRYPFDAYGAVMVRDPSLYYALETQGRSTFAVGRVDEATVAHELAHQWFGDSVTVARWRDLWLAEGFATYLELLWDNRFDGPGFDLAMRRLHAYVVANEVGPAVVSRPEDIFADNTYYRGALVLYALRESVGDPAFFRTLRAWHDAYRGGNATTAQFVDLAARVTGRPAVRPLLRAFIYDRVAPPLPGTDRAAAAAAVRPEAPTLGIGVRRR